MPKCKNKNCGKLFKAKFSSFDKCCSDVCLTEYRVQYAMKAAEKYRKDREKERKDKDKAVIDALKEKHKDGPWYKIKLQDDINLICRLIGKDQPCISCGNFGKMAGGHRFNVKDNSTWRWNLHCLEPQCYRCNDSKSGNLDGYDEGLISIYGKEYYEYVRFGMKNAYPIIKLNLHELIAARNIAMQIIKELNKIDMVYPPMVRLRMKDEINTRIGIYTKPFKDSEK